jgi:hypothetical protein
MLIDQTAAAAAASQAKAQAEKPSGVIDRTCSFVQAAAAAHHTAELAS